MQRLYSTYCRIRYKQKPVLHKHCVKLLALIPAERSVFVMSTVAECWMGPQPNDVAHLDCTMEITTSISNVIHSHLCLRQKCLQSCRLLRIHTHAWEVGQTARANLRHVLLCSPHHTHSTHSCYMQKPHFSVFYFPVLRGFNLPVGRGHWSVAHLMEALRFSSLSPEKAKDWSV